MTELDFEIDQDTGALKVIIDTERLHMESVTSEKITNYCELLGNAEVMAKFATGEVWTIDQTTKRVNLWADRWVHRDPFSSFAISKNDDDRFIGHVVLGHGNEGGQSELAYVFNKPYWGHGYGNEAVCSVVNEYAPKLHQHNYKIDGVRFSSITATVRDDNEASSKILRNSGMECLRDEIKYGHKRHVFFKSILAQPNTTALPQDEDILDDITPQTQRIGHK